jgi:hypothetical protein
MCDELERIWKEAAVAESGYYPGICLEGVKEITKDLIQVSRCPGRDSNKHFPNRSLGLYHHSNPLRNNNEHSFECACVITAKYQHALL